MIQRLIDYEIECPRCQKHLTATRPDGLPHPPVPDHSHEEFGCPGVGKPGIIVSATLRRDVP